MTIFETQLLSEYDYFRDTTILEIILEILVG